MPDLDLGKFWETLKSSGAQTSFLVALLGQATTGLVFQVRNNETQEAAIHANTVAIGDFRDQVSNLNTPLGQRFIKLEDQVSEAIRIGQGRLAQTERLADQLNQLTDRLITMDRRLLEIEIKLRPKEPEQPK